jgi:hypothetical protein
MRSSADGLPTVEMARRGLGSSGSRQRPWFDGSRMEALGPRAATRTKACSIDGVAPDFSELEQGALGSQLVGEARDCARFGRWGNEGQHDHELSSRRPWWFGVTLARGGGREQSGGE